MTSRNCNQKDNPPILMGESTTDNTDLSTKTVLAVSLNELIDQLRLNQREVVEINSMSLPKLSQVRHYNLQNISLNRLMQALVSLDQRVEMFICSARRAHTADITVNLV